MRRLNLHVSLRPTPCAAWTVGAAWLGLTLLGSLSNASDFRQAQGLLDAYATSTESALVGSDRHREPVTRYCRQRRLGILDCVYF